LKFIERFSFFLFPFGTIQFKDDDYEIATATTIKEIKQLGSVGFVKYGEMNGIHFYRKPKKYGV
jgi:hypothetical protein